MGSGFIVHTCTCGPVRWRRLMCNQAPARPAWPTGSRDSRASTPGGRRVLLVRWETTALDRGPRHDPPPVLLMILRGVPPGRSARLCSSCYLAVGLAVQSLAPVGSYSRHARTKVRCLCLVEIALFTRAVSSTLKRGLRMSCHENERGRFCFPEKKE